MWRWFGGLSRRRRANTALALVTELFRDWKAPVADKAREIIKWYLAEVQKLTTEAQKKAA